MNSNRGANALQGVNFGAPRPAEPRTPIQELAGNAQRILDIFTANGYAIKVAQRAITHVADVLTVVQE